MALGTAPRAVTTWQVAASVPALNASQVHVWKAGIQELAPHYEQFRGILNEAELARARAFLVERARLEYVVAHGVLRTLLGHYAEQAARALQFEAGAYGKPYLTGAEHAGLAFNLSHSGDVILVAVGRDRAIGVDVEQWSDRTSIEELDRVAELAFSPRERANVRALAPEAYMAAFYATWTRKEAYLKSTGAGITQGLEHFDVSCGPGDAQLIADRQAPGNVYAWKLHDLPLESRYSGALAIDDVSRHPHTLAATPPLVVQLLMPARSVRS